MQRWWAYLVGYVRLTVRGGRPESFLNLAVSRGLLLWDVRRYGRESLSLKTRARDVFPLRHIARQTACRLRIEGKHGWPFVWARWRRRRASVAGALCFVVTLYLLSLVVWSVVAVAPEGWQRLTPEEVLAAAADLGLKPGVWRGSLDAALLGRELALRLPEASWVAVEVRGIEATIQVVERLWPGEVQAPRAAHLVAAKDGVVEEVLVLAGQAQVRPGDTVRRGQVLISGLVRPSRETPAGSVSEPPATPYLLRAQGVVWARVWYEAVARQPLVEAEERLTGRAARAVYLTWGNRALQVWGPKAPPYAYYKVRRTVKYFSGWRNYHLPVELLTVTYQELVRERRSLSRAQALEVARARAVAQISRLIPPAAEVREQRFSEVWSAGGREVVVRGLVEVREDITRVYPLLE